MKKYKGKVSSKNSQNTFLFSGPFSNASHLQNKPEYWTEATDEEHLEAMRMPVNRINQRWMYYIQKNRPYLLDIHLQRRKQHNFNY